MNGKENIERYIEAHKTLDELYDLTDWVAEKLGSIYISGSGYYDFRVSNGKATGTRSR